MAVAPHIQLRRTDENAAEIEALATRFGGAVGIEGVIANLSRQARPTTVEGSAVTRAYAWEERDNWDPRWWPQVRAVAKLGPDTAWVRCRSALPYTLDLVLDAVSRTPPVVEVALSGDLSGYARFTLTAVEGGTRLEFAQQVRVGGRLALALYVGRPVLRPR